MEYRVPIKAVKCLIKFHLQRFLCQGKASLGFGDNKSMFRLKKNGKKLSSEDYQDDLERYFEGAKAATSISIADLKNILNALEGKNRA